MRIIDISNEILSSEVYPGDPVPKLVSVKSFDNGDAYNLKAVYTGLHCGTHIDAPLHFFNDGEAIDKMNPERFIGPCTVIKTPSGILTGADIERIFPRTCERVLLKGNGRTYLHESAASEIAYRGCKLLGIDGLSIEKVGSTGAAHRALLSQSVALLEGLNLREVDEGVYFLIAPPIKIARGEAAPARAMLICDYLFWGGNK